MERAKRTPAGSWPLAMACLLTCRTDQEGWSVLIASSNSAASGGSAATGRGRPGALQMGPPELPGGNRALRAARSRPPGRFNGAAGITRRKLIIVRRPAAAQRASMGPPELPGGNQQHRQLPGEGLKVASMGPPELPGGNLTALPAELLAPACFNGAAGITRRKRARISARRRSLGMLQWGRRNYPAETTTTTINIRQLTNKLQWGRRNYPAETSFARNDARAAVIASMGPPELPGGNDFRCDRCRQMSRWLQWGRRNYPAETKPARTITPRR